jgi:hypothetical protein
MVARSNSSEQQLMPEIAGQPVGIIDNDGGDGTGVHQIAQRPQARPVHRGARQTFVNEDMTLRNRVPLACGERLAGFELGGN